MLNNVKLNHRNDVEGTYNCTDIDSRLNDYASSISIKLDNKKSSLRSTVNSEHAWNVQYHTVNYNGKSYRLKLVFTDHCISRSAERVIHKDQIISLIDQGMRYVIDNSTYNKPIPHKYKKKFTKLISSINNFYLISKCLWSNDPYKLDCMEDSSISV